MTQSHENSRNNTFKQKHNKLSKGTKRMFSDNLCEMDHPYITYIALTSNIGNSARIGFNLETQIQGKFILRK